MSLFEHRGSMLSLLPSVLFSNPSRVTKQFFVSESARRMLPEVSAPHFVLVTRWVPHLQGWRHLGN
jgi:hypothetical protein